MAVHRECGYDGLELPLCSPEERVAFNRVVDRGTFDQECVAAEENDADLRRRRQILLLGQTIMGNDLAS